MHIWMGAPLQLVGKGVGVGWAPSSPAMHEGFMRGPTKHRGGSAPKRWAQHILSRKALMPRFSQSHPTSQPVL